MHLRLEHVSVARVMQQAVESVWPELAQAAHAVDIRLPPASIRVNGDPARLVQVFSNLLGNAVKFTPAGGRIEFMGGPHVGGVRVTVRDTGIGIAPAALDRIFSLFHQEPDSRGEPTTGLGIGLTLSRSLVGMHGGSIVARSNGVGQGTLVEVTLPIVEDAHLSCPVALATTAAHGLRVLVVDDNMDAADMLTLFIASHGHEARAAYDGDAAVSEALAFRPDVVLLDIGMPRADGYEVARRFRARRELQHVVIAAVTGWGQDDDRRRAREAGFDCHLTKPAEPDVVTHLLAAVAEGRPCKGCTSCLTTERRSR